MEMVVSETLAGSFSSIAVDVQDEQGRGSKEQEHGADDAQHLGSIGESRPQQQHKEQGHIIQGTQVNELSTVVITRMQDQKDGHTVEDTQLNHANSTLEKQRVVDDVMECDNVVEVVKDVLSPNVSEATKHDMVVQDQEEAMEEENAITADIKDINKMTSSEVAGYHLSSAHAEASTHKQRVPTQVVGKYVRRNTKARIKLQVQCDGDQHCASAHPDENPPSDQICAIFQDNSGRLGPLWFRRFIFTQHYHEFCNEHQNAIQNANKEHLKLKYFCVGCVKGPFCKFGKIKHRDHGILQTRKASGTISIKCDDMKKMANSCMDFSLIKEWSINLAPIYYIRSRPQYTYPKGRQELLCINCQRSMEAKHNTDRRCLFCSLECKLVVNHRDPFYASSFRSTTPQVTKVETKVEEDYEKIAEDKLEALSAATTTATTNPTSYVLRRNRR